MMLLGGALEGGGRITADWPGLAPAQLFEGRDLRPTASSEAMIAEALAAHFGLDPRQVQQTLFAA